ncbi:MAG: esterase [Prevotella sp.]|jgi:predicted esterase YcpF (UPF0227 family)|nr:esterase [Prevotella sp.]MCI2081471.1 esterase [Prevotella sp.]MCI2103342.1 esterase [Prevotella sp.]
MDNLYIKQYPDLMSGKTILYIHGFGSSAQSGTVKRIQDTLPNAKVIAYDMPLHPEEAMELLHRICEEQKPDLIIGSSMGGMYTEMLYGFDRICVNPAFQMAETMKEHGMTGKQLWQNPRADGEKEFIVTKALEKEYKLMTEHCFSHVTAEEQQRCWGAFGDEDPLVHTFELFREHYPQAVHFHGEHRMNDKSFLHGIVPIIRWISDRQEGKERNIVYIDRQALMDDYGKPMSSLYKAYDFLIERYNVYLVAPAPTNDHASLDKIAQWIEQYLSTPAHDHVIYTNQKQLLYGDYFIDPHPCEEFMGTTIQLGSDDFKTWEEIITYFDRLGGQ